MGPPPRGARREPHDRAGYQSRFCTQRERQWCRRDSPPAACAVVVFSLKGSSRHDDRDARDFILDSRSAVDRRRVPSGSGRVSTLELKTSHRESPSLSFFVVSEFVGHERPLLCVARCAGFRPKHKQYRDVFDLISINIRTRDLTVKGCGINQFIIHDQFTY